MKRKIFNGLFNIIIYSMLAWSIISAGYVALPQEYKELIPEFNWLTALISGGSTALIGSAGVIAKTLLTKSKKDNEDKLYNLTFSYAMMERKVTELQDLIIGIKEENNSLKEAINKNSELLKVDLEAKLSNPLIEAEIKKLIEGVVSE